MALLFSLHLFGRLIVSINVSIAVHLFISALKIQEL